MTLQNPWALAVLGVVAVALTAYVLLAGGDFGGGVWDLLASGPRKREQRNLVAHAIGPIWEANHVWLILVLVLLFVGFPKAFSTLSIVLHIPLTLMLVGIVLRGSAFTFRAYEIEPDAAQRHWGLLFSGASVVTPVLLGICVGAVADGAVGRADGATFAARYVDPWLAPFPVAVGVLTLVLFAFLAAVYCTVVADDWDLAEDFRRRALWSGVAVFAAAGVALAVSSREAPDLLRGVLLRPLAIPLQLATALAALTALGALWVRRYPLARAAAAAQVVLILWGWMAAQYPYVVPPQLPYWVGTAPDITLQLLLGALGLGAFVLLPSLWYLFRVFKK